MRYYQTVPFPVGPVTVMEEGGWIVFIGFLPTLARPQKRKRRHQGAFRQLSDYFDGELKTFDLPLKLSGTPFQLRTWAALQTIPYGKTCSYGDIAKQIGNGKANRAVGMANHNNPISIVIPCHRVIGANGSLTGYGGGLPIKRQLLELEKHYSRDHILLFSEKMPLQKTEQFCILKIINYHYYSKSCLYILKWFI